MFEKLSASLGRKIENWYDLYELKNAFSDGKKISSFPHLLGLDEAKIVPIPYGNSKGINQEELVKLMDKRRVLVSLKHHASSPILNKPKESMKLQSTHAQMIVRSGDTVMSLNNPQGYEDGLFGDESYPMMFFGLDFPEDVTEEEIRSYENNMILWGLAINHFSTFPNDYNGGDPLMCRNNSELSVYGDRVIDALLGDTASKNFLMKPENGLYCAEMVFGLICLGVQHPLSASALGNEKFNRVKEAFLSRNFLSDSENPQISSVEMIFPLDSLKPLRAEYDSGDGYFGEGLAIQPMLCSELITSFIKYSVPRKRLGEDSGLYQLELLDHAGVFLKEYLPEDSLKRGSTLDTLLSKLKGILASNHGTYENFKERLVPVLSSIDDEVEKVSNTGNTFFPPHCFLVRALENTKEGKVKGALGLSYFGHGVHSRFC